MGRAVQQVGGPYPHRRPVDLPAADRGQVLPVSEPALPDRPLAPPGSAGAPGRLEHRRASRAAAPSRSAGRRGPCPGHGRRRYGRERLVPPSGGRRVRRAHRRPACPRPAQGAGRRAGPRPRGPARRPGPRTPGPRHPLGADVGEPRPARRCRTPGRGPAAGRVRRTGRIAAPPGDRAAPQPSPPGGRPVRGVLQPARARAADRRLDPAAGTGHPDLSGRSAGDTPPRQPRPAARRPGNGRRPVPDRGGRTPRTLAGRAGRNGAAHRRARHDLAGTLRDRVTHGAPGDPALP